MSNVRYEILRENRHGGDEGADEDGADGVVDAGHGSSRPLWGARGGEGRPGAEGCRGRRRKERRREAERSCIRDESRTGSPK